MAGSLKIAIQILLCAIVGVISGTPEPVNPVSVAQAVVSKAQDNVNATLALLRQNCQGYLPQNESAEATQARRQLLAQRLQELSVSLQQQATNQTWTPGVNCFTAMTDEERKRVVMTPETGAALQSQALVKPPNASFPSNVSTPQATTSPIDWRSYNGLCYVSPVRNQGGCGSCWVFATAAALEAQTLIKRMGGAPLPGPSTKINIAEQQLLNCAPDVAYGSWAPRNPCSGGDPRDAYEWARNHGFVGEARRRYIPNPPADTWYPCQSRVTFLAPQYIGPYVSASSPWVWYDSDIRANVASIKTELLNGPVVIMLYASDRFGYYSNGVFACTTAETKTPLNHAMLVVGWAPASGTTPAHWIVKNSWDTWWGEQGYIRIHMGIYKDCGISRTYAFRATIYS